VRRIVVVLLAGVVLGAPVLAEATHVRPLGAGKVSTPLVPAYQQCTAPDRTHGAPLAFGSCSGPQQTSGYLTVGTHDANGTPPQSIGSFRVVALPGNPGPPNDNKVAFEVSIKDVRCQGVSTGCPGALQDYSGTLEARIPIQNTDHINGPDANGGADPATGKFTLAFDLSCAATADPDIGSRCSRNIGYIEDLFPSGINDGKRTLWEFDQLQVWDGGADGNGLTHEGDTLFAVQGVFVP
jgi:hypothetical protein